MKEEEKLREFIDFTDTFYNTVLDFSERWNLIEHHPTKPGYYLTLRFTWTRLYTLLDEWRDDDLGFQKRIIDGSKIIGWREISEEDKKKLEDYVREITL